MATTFYAFRRTVTTSGTPVQLDTFSVEPDQTVLVKAKATNSGVISIGNSSAEALNSNAENFLLAAGQSVELKIPNTNEVWIDSTSSGDVVEVLVGGSGSSNTSDEVSLSEALTGISAGVENDNVLTAPFRRADAFHSNFNGTSSTSVQQVKAATASKKHYVTDFRISTDTAQWISIVDGASTVLFGPYYMPANSVLPVSLKTPTPGSTNTALNVDCSGSSGNVTVDIEGYTI